MLVNKLNVNLDKLLKPYDFINGEMIYQGDSRAIRPYVQTTPREPVKEIVLTEEDLKQVYATADAATVFTQQNPNGRVITKAISPISETTSNIPLYLAALGVAFFIIKRKKSTPKKVKL